MHESKLTAKGQTTLPRDVRAALNLEPGDTLRYLVLDGEVRILKARPVAGLGGMLRRPKQSTVTLAEMDDAISAGAME
jgi:AbrB family looped-hinge helix DNA binding protein